MERLQKVLAHAGVASRRAAERLIDAGRVTVNGVIVRKLGSRVDPQRDSVRVDGKRIPAAPADHLYLMLHKPRGYVTTLADPQGRPTIRDLFQDVRRRVYPVGRLDFHSEGLLLLTDDGELARDLMHPRNRVQRTYLVRVRGVPDAAALARLAAGPLVEGRRSLPAKVRRVPGAPDRLEITVTEGKKHQVRKMLQAIGHPVVRLKRLRYGGVRLGTLKPGGMRSLSRDEVERLRRSCRAGAPGGESTARASRRN